MSQQATASTFPGGELIQRLERIEKNLAQLASALDQVVTTMPNAVATAADVFDEFLLAAQQKGIDLDAVIHSGGHALQKLAELTQSPQFARLMDSAALSPDTVDLAARTGDALVETSHEAAGKAGFLALFRATRDPDVQRALDFCIRFMKRFGQALGERTENAEEDTHV